MKQTFVTTSNVKRFVKAVAKLEGRGAPEQSIVLGTGNAGYGKTRVGMWWAQQNDAIFLRVKSAMTPHWMLTDLLAELGEHSPATNCEKCFNQALAELGRNPRPIVVDEIENGLANIKVLETVRDLSDTLGLELVFLGREGVYSKLKRYPHFRTRIAAHAEFEPTSARDVRLCADQLLDLRLADDLIEEITARSGGHVRKVMEALRSVERAHPSKKGDTVTLADMKGHPLVVEDKRRDDEEDGR
jgi:DNA transposition AAA+ family ATPase